jgi:hypothetical protein
MAAGSISYIASKVRLGKKREFVHSVALYDAKCLNEEEPYEPDQYDILVDMIQSREHPHAIQTQIRDMDPEGDLDYLRDFGYTIHPDVLWTWSAAKHVWKVVQEDGCRK